MLQNLLFAKIDGLTKAYKSYPNIPSRLFLQGRASEIYRRRWRRPSNPVGAARNVKKCCPLQRGGYSGKSDF